MSQTKVAMIGMGYVGAVTAAALARRGCRVVGVECNPVKLAQLSRGRSPVREPGLDEAMRKAFSAGDFEATSDLEAAVRYADLIMVAVGTPSDQRGKADLTAIDRVISQIVEALDGDARARVLMIRSTVPPGTTGERIVPLVERARLNVAVCHHPEFLREGSALSDWADPPMIVYGCLPGHRERVEAMIETIYRGIDAPRVALAPAESELMKYACNVFHAIKVDFANEIGELAAASGADGKKVMAAFCQDRRLNISPAYLKPGFAFGGSCLPKDTRALSAIAEKAGLELPLVESVLASNGAHLDRQVQRVLAHGRRATLLVGLTFKAGTDDLRESPMVELAERLLGKGVPLTIYDPDLPGASAGALVGANARYVEEHLPHLRELLRGDLAGSAAGAETVVIAKNVPGLEQIDLTGKAVVDLTGKSAAESSERSLRTVAIPCAMAA